MGHEVDFSVSVPRPHLRPRRQIQPLPVHQLKEQCFVTSQELEHAKVNKARSHSQTLTGVELLDDELDLSIHVGFVVFDETFQNVFHALQPNIRCSGILYQDNSIVVCYVSYLTIAFASSRITGIARML